MPAPRHNGQYDMYVILIRLAALPSQKLKPLFEASQWKSLKGHLDQYRNLRKSWVEAGIFDEADFAEPAAEEKP
jgi:hypothetical protein